MMHYRREIDGLRALAVLPVILFHAGFSLFSGGFVGVDVFFVISGYLITSIIMMEKGAGTFTIVGFYERRARRILPALFMVMACCLPFAWLWLIPQDLKSFSQSVVAVSLFASNILFWQNSGYFDTAAELKPLLHTWSLAVEEQYYVLFPVLLMLVWQLGRRGIFLLFLTFACVSLGVAQWASLANPNAAFYLLPTRGWELLVGALAAVYASGKAIRQPSAPEAEVGGAMGVLLILYAIFKFDAHTPFPGLFALAPTLGAVLIILYASPSTYAGKLLGSRFLVGVGLVSYSAYLWHQPLLAFARHRTIEEPSQYLMVVLVMGSVLMALLTWKYVEIPFRNKMRVSGRSVLIFSVLGTGLFLGIGLAGHRSNGLILRGLRSADYVALTGYQNYFNGKSEEEFWNSGCFNLSQGIEFFKKNGCEKIDFPGRPKVFLIGDSHSAYLSQYLRGFLKEKRLNLIQYSTAYCTPLSLKDSRERCAQINDYLLRRMADERPEYLILSAYYFAWADGLEYGEPLPYEEFIRQMTGKIRSMGVSKVIVIGQMPTWMPSLPATLLKNFIIPGRQIEKRTFSGVNPKSFEWDSKLRSQSYPDGVQYKSLKSLLCNDEGCLTLVGNDVSKDLVVYDYGHLTAAGSKFVTQNMLVSVFAE